MADLLLDIGEILVYQDKLWICTVLLVQSVLSPKYHFLMWEEVPYSGAEAFRMLNIFYVI